jgi:hypothetical protein
MVVKNMIRLLFAVCISMELNGAAAGVPEAPIAAAEVPEEAPEDIESAKKVLSAWKGLMSAVKIDQNNNLVATQTLIDFMDQEACVRDFGPKEGKKIAKRAKVLNDICSRYRGLQEALELQKTAVCKASREFSGWRALGNYMQQLAIIETGVQKTSDEILDLGNEEYCKRNFGPEEGAQIAATAQFVHKICSFYNNNLLGLRQVRNAQQERDDARKDLQRANNQVRVQARQLTDQDTKLKEFEDLRATFETHKDMLTGELARSHRIYNSLFAQVMKLNPQFAFQGVDPSTEEKIDQMIELLNNKTARALQPRASTGLGAAALSAGGFSLLSHRVGSTIAERLQSESAPQFLQNVDKESLEPACGAVAMITVAGAVGYGAMKIEERFLAIKNPETKRKIRNRTGLLGLVCGAGVAVPKLWALAQGQPVVWEKYDTPLLVTSGTLLAASQRMDSAMLQTF